MVTARRPYCSSGAMVIGIARETKELRIDDNGIFTSPPSMWSRNASRSGRNIQADGRINAMAPEPERNRANGRGGAQQEFGTHAGCLIAPEEQAALAHVHNPRAVEGG